MKLFFSLVFLFGIPVIAWLPARLWTICGDPWCLAVYPEWLDSKIYSLARPYLDEEISIAAEQMEFLEVWISSVIIVQAFTLAIFFLCRDKFTEDDLGPPM